MGIEQAVRIECGVSIIDESDTENYRAPERRSCTYCNQNGYSSQNFMNHHRIGVRVACEAFWLYIAFWKGRESGAGRPRVRWFAH